MKKIENAVLQAFLKLRAEMLALENEEDGMEMLETVILIGIAVIIGVVVLELLTGKGHDGKGGIVSSIFAAINKKLGELFGTGNYTSPT